MNSEGAAPTPHRPKIRVSAPESKDYAERLKLFQISYQEEIANFNSSEQTIYYLVSVKFVEAWRNFCMESGPERNGLPLMNQDLLDKKTQSLKPGLKQKQHFQFFSQRIFRLFSNFPGKVIKRNAVKLDQQKRVPVYLNIYEYLIIKNSDLRQIDQRSKSRNDFSLSKIEDSEYSDVKSLLENIKESQHYSSKDYDYRLWRVDQNQNLDTLYGYLKKAADRASSQYRIKGFGKKLDDNIKLEDLKMEKGDFFVVELKQKGRKWFLQSDNQKKCEGCYDVTELKFPCECEKVGYCSESCKQKDKRFHLRNCCFAEMEELNKKIEMKLTKKSVRGVVGLRNLGNTCFMNSCLQCLSNTLPLTQYFLNSYYQSEINKVNPLGTKGKLVKSYAKFIKGTWCNEDDVFQPDGIKSAVSSINHIFSGYAQHDSQQFFSFLVDGLHEDLNRIEKKPYVQSIQSQDKPDQVIALESWISHIKRNQSIISDLMTGQYKSKVKCPDCKKQSITFDPFITVTLPIPENKVNIMSGFVIYKNFESKTKRIAFKYEKANHEEWIKSIANIIDKKQKELLIYVVTIKEGVYRAGRDSTAQILNKIQNQEKNMFCVQLSEEEMNYSQVVELIGRFSQQRGYYKDSYENVWYKFPFFFEKKITTGKTIFLSMIKFLYEAYDGKKSSSFFSSGTTYEEYENLMLKKRPFQIWLRYDKKIDRYGMSVQYRYAEEILIKDDTRLQDILEKISQRDCQLDMRFSKAGSENFTFDKLRSFEDQAKKIKLDYASEDKIVQISQCFENLREKEQLESGNEWYCPSCKDHKLAQKQMAIYKTPKILILHLKRFKQKGNIKKQKNESKVIFPMMLNMKDYVIDPKPMTSYREEAIKQQVFLPPKYEESFIKCSAEPKYELYAVSNHYGGLGGGHYTAYAKNDGKWFSFDDSSVREVSESHVISSGAYILFYKRLD